MPRPQFSLKTLLWLMVVVAAFFGGAEWAKRRWAEREAILRTDLKKAQEVASDCLGERVLSALERYELKEDVEGYRERFGLIPRRERPGRLFTQSNKNTVTKD